LLAELEFKNGESQPGDAEIKKQNGQERLRTTFGNKHRQTAHPCHRGFVSKAQFDTL
jgi:hypothetical protein